MSRPPPLLRPGLALAAALLLCACQPVNSMDQQGSTRAGATPEFKRNPNPVQAYEVTLRLEDAPGEFGVIEGFASYGFDGDACLPPRHPVMGVQTAVATASLPIYMARAADGVYTGVVHGDAFQDSDYYGEGECRWVFGGLDFTLQATGGPGETRFLTSLTARKLLGVAEETRFYWKGRFPRDAMDDFPDSGSVRLTDYKPVYRDELFVIRLALVADPK